MIEAFEHCALALFNYMTPLVDIEVDDERIETFSSGGMD